jgi:rsbT co-antagonist protein RsbR
MNNKHEQPDINGLKAQIAALEELIEVYEGTSLKQAERLEQALRLREQAEEDLTHERNALQAIVGQQQRLIDTIRELSAPLLPVHDGILVMPLIGHIDSARSAQIMEELLTGVQQYQADFVIIDITGVPIVDTAVANHLIQTTHAVSLLGARCILVGISPEVAQTLVQLGVDLQRLTTSSNLQAGITYAIEHRP